MSSLFWTNYSRGYVVEIVEDGEEVCESWILLPAENLWSVGVRGFLYILAMVYLFLGIAIASDLFMCSIEVITSQRRRVVRWDEEKQEKIEKEVLVWNETVANLTLMAVGSSAPEILLSVIDTSTKLGKPPTEDSLGTFTIIGSAAFNLLIITAICIASVPSPDTKRVKGLGVFLMTSAWSIFAYLWMLMVLSWWSPGEIKLWEAWVTLGFCPLLVLSAYCQDKNWWSSACQRSSSVDAMQSQTNVRVVTDKRRPSMMQGLAKELGALEKEKQRNSMANLKMVEEGSIREPTPSEEGSLTKLVPSRPGSAASISNKNIARARFRFRHAAVRSLLGGKKRPLTASQPHARAHIAEVASFLQTSPEELVGKFTFASPSYSVLESAGIISIDVLFHRVPPGTGATPTMNGTANGNAKTGMAPVEGNNTETSFINGNLADKPKKHRGTVAIEFETREGSGKIEKDFKYTQGKLVFSDDEYKKTITVPIINDNQYEADVDFYILLKNPEGDSSIGDPNICRVTIIDDDEPGEFQFSEPHYYADIKAGVVNLEVTRQKGCDGTVTLEYTTVDGTAKGGDKLDNNCDYKRSEGIVTFLHNESSKVITVDINKATKESKNFIITLKNPSLGAKIGEHGAAVAYLNKDVLDERIADILDDDDEVVTWGGQFRNAMTLSDDDPENPLQWYDYLLHFLSFFWKVLLAFIPPKHYLGSYPCFVCSLLAIAGMTAVVEQLGTLLGCVLNIKASVAGITIIALGTSVPDTFASRTAALHDSGADAAIGNITGSNSVNVFLGLGLPWVMSAMYAYFNGTKFEVNTKSLVQSVVMFTICGSMCIVMLLIRRRFAGGELGGARTSKYLCSLFLVVLWSIYIVISSVDAYHPDVFPW